MSNIDKAAGVVKTAIRETWNRGPIFDTSTLHKDIAQALADAGLLAPELPEAEQVTDNLHVIDVNADFAVCRYQGTVTLVVESPANEHYMGAWSARQLALALLAAADYAEGK